VAKKLRSEAIVFGASGSIGKSIVKELKSQHEVTRVSTKKRPGYFTLNSTEDYVELRKLKKKFSAVVWANGQNTNDSILNLNEKTFLEVLDANLLYIINSSKFLLDHNLLKNGAKLCIISSIWQNLSRNDKFSYTVSKSALLGLVQSFSCDLAQRGMRVNAILPGPLNNEMTKKALSKNQLAKMLNETPYNKLINSKQVGKVAKWICSSESDGVVSQFIELDYGYSKLRQI